MDQLIANFFLPVTTPPTPEPMNLPHELPATFYDSIVQRNFSLPHSVIYQIAKNPTSPKVYQKMIQTCKYFFIKNPILIISDVSFVDYDKQ